MKEAVPLDAARVFFHFLWIAGTSWILASFSYHDFLARRRKGSLLDVLRQPAILTSFLGGAVFVAAGVGLATPLLGLKLACGAAAAAAVVAFIRLAAKRKS